MFKLKLVLYLVISDFLISLNTNNYSTATTLDAIKRSGKKKKSVDQAQQNQQSDASEPIESNVDSNPPGDPAPDPGVSSGQNSSTTLASTTTTDGTTASTETVEPDTTTKSSTTTTTESNEKQSVTNQQQDRDQDEIEKQMTKAGSKTKQARQESPGHHTVHSDVPDTVFGDKSIVKEFHEIQELPGKRNKIRWNTTDPGRILDKTKPLTPSSLYPNKFSDEKHQLRTSSHGLYFNYYGSAMIFHELFQHFIKFEIPEKTTLKKEFEKQKCLEFIKTSMKSLSKTLTGNEFLEQHCKPDTGDGVPPCTMEIPERYSKICDRLVHYYDKQVIELQDIIDETYSSFEKNLKRRKRFVITGAVAALIAGSFVAGGIGGAITGGVTGYFSGKAAAKHEVAQLEAVLEMMEKNMSRIADSVRINTETLAGLSQTVTDMEKDLKAEMKIMNDNTRYQVKNLEDSLKEVSMELEVEMRINALTKALEDYVNLHLSSLRNIMIVDLQHIRDWEEIFNVLSFGRIPKKLIGYNRLKGLLNQIHQQIYTNFELSLNDDEFPLYYTLPISTYSIAKKDGLFSIYLQIRIPLKIIRVNHRFNIISVHAHSFPCLNNVCILDKGKLTSGDLQSFDLPQTSYLVNPTTHQIQHEINLDFLDCQENGKSKFCYTYNPTVLQRPSSCTMAIYNWNETEIVRWCKFRPGQREEYRIIPIEYNLYLMHRDVVKSYTQFCPDTPDEQIMIDEWAETLIIPEFCEVFIESTSQRFLGPFSKVLRAHTVAKRISYHSSLIMKINAKYSNLTKIPFQIHDTTRFIRSIEEKFKLNDKANEIVNTRLSSEELSKVALFNIQAQKALKASMENLNTKFKTYTYHGSFWGYISLIGDSIQMLTSLCVIFGIISFSNIFGIIGATLVIIPARAVDAWEIQLIPDFKLFPDITVDVLDDVSSIAFFMNVGFVILFIGLMILFVCYGVFRKVVITEHYGKGFPLLWVRETNWDTCDCCLMLHLQYQGHMIKHIKIENLHIKLNIDAYFSEAVKSVQVKNKLLTWFISTQAGALSIELSEPVHLLGFNSNGLRIEEANYHVTLPIDQSAFNSLPRSEAIRKKGNYGIAYLDTVIKVRRPQAGKSMGPPPRYVEILHPTAPIAEEQV